MQFPREHVEAVSTGIHFDLFWSLGKLLQDSMTLGMHPNDFCFLNFVL
jgi:hypothetical protein